MLRILTLCPLFACALLAGCGRASPAAQEERAAEAAWRMPPRVETVQVTRGRIVLTGTAQPGARVVMRDGAGTAHAATAGADGDFEIDLEAPGQALLLRPEDQDGQRALPAPEMIVVTPDGAAAALSPGVASRRLDAGQGLGAVDSDGRMVIVTGRTGADRAPARVRVGGGQEMEVAGDARGVWTVRADASGPFVAITVDGTEFRAPLGGTAPGAITIGADGTRIGWSAPDGAVLTTWIPRR